MKKLMTMLLCMLLLALPSGFAAVHTEYELGYGYKVQGQYFSLPSNEKVQVKENLQTAFAAFDLYFDDNKTFGLGFEYMNDYPGVLIEYGGAQAKQRGFSNTIGLSLIYNHDFSSIMALHSSLGFGTTFRNSSSDIYIPSYGGYTDYGEIDLKILSDIALSFDIASTVYINAGVKTDFMFMKYITPMKKAGSLTVKSDPVKLDGAFGYEIIPYASISLVL